MKPTKVHFVTVKTLAALLIILILIALAGCKTVPEEQHPEPVHISRNLTDPGRFSAQQLADFFLSQNPDHDADHILAFAQLYITEAAMENINSDIAFAQMCHETGFLCFGGLIQSEWHNYCGLGAISAEQPGCIFETEQLGVRAHIQHIQAYATTEDVALNNELVDPRYSWVHKTKYAVTLQEMAASWATNPAYAESLEGLLQRMEASTL